MPLKIIKKNPFGVRWSLWNIDNSQETPEEIHEGFFNAERFAAITHPEIRAQYIAARKALAELTGSVGSLSFLPNGKPVYEPRGIVSLSHTTGLAAACFHPILACGIDIERTARRFSPAVIRRFTRPDEMSELERLGPAHFWCAKEAVYKANGKPGLIFNTHIHVFWTKITPTQLLGYAETTGGKKWLVENVVVDGTIVSIACEGIDHSHSS
jgi:4'-phosphopantetheinyl transferase